ncbi:MAG: VanZ family protein [Lachnospiraceae bacterium]|nr:VanZ family protein [Lachnospiraceae bacterium]
MKRVIRIFLRFIPAVFWMTAIYRFSAMSAVSSTYQSVSVTGRLINFISRFADIDSYTREQLIVILEPYIRKTAHMCEYGLLFLLLVIPMGIIIRNEAVNILFCGFISLLYSVTDEYHQTLVTGRSGEIRDIMIDMIGVLSAMLFYNVFILAVSAVRGRRRRVKNNH